MANLIDVITTISARASAAPAVGSVIRDDIFKLNALPDIKYGAFAIVEGTHNLSADGGLLTFNFYLYYVDRLVAYGDGEDNTAAVHSTGVEVISNIVRYLREVMGWDVPAVTFTSFLERFKDECAGVYAGVAVTVPASYTCTI